MPRGRAAYLGQGRGGPVPSAPHLGRAQEASGAGPGPPGPPGTPRASTGRGPSPLGTAARSDPSPPRPLALDTARAGPVPPVPRGQGRAAARAPRHRGTRAAGPSPRPAPLPAPPAPAVPARRVPIAGAPAPPGRSRSARRCRSPPAPATGPALPTPSSRRARRTARAATPTAARGHAHRGTGTRPPRHGDTPTSLACPAELARWLLRPRVPGASGCPGDPSLLGHARCRRSRGAASPGGAAPGTGAGGSTRQVCRTPGHRDARDPRCEGPHRDPRLRPVLPLGRAPARQHRRSHGRSPGWHRHRTRLGVSGARPPPAGLGHTATSWTWTLDPAGDWHYQWISLMVLPILYNWVVLILRCCFPEVQEAHAGLWQALDGLSDALYLLDIIVHLHTGFLEDGILVRDARRTRRRYLGSWSFPWDVVAVLPTELLCLLPGVPRVPGVPAARANRCLRVPRLFEAFDRCETRTGWPNAFRMAKLMLYLLLGIHWHACLYFTLSARLGLGTDPWVCPSFPRLLRRYLHSFYISTLVLAMVGDTPAAQREEELLFLTAGFLLAVLGFATITGSISTVIVNLSSAASALYPEAGPVRRYLRARGAGGRLAARVARWHQHLRAQRKLPAEWRVLQHLPRGLRAEVAASVHLAALQRVGLFRGWERGVLRQLVLRLRPQVFGPGEFVCRRGDVGREMYFIREGRLAVLAADGVTQLAVLGEGLYFGEISLINIKGNMAGNRRTANILSIGYSDLFCLGKEDLAEVLAEFPSARAAMEAKGRELLLRMGQLDTGAEAAALAAEAEAERRLRGLEAALEGLQTRAARLLAQLEASALRMALRVRRLEGRLQLRDGAVRDRARSTGAHDVPGAQGVPRGAGVPRD
uniref:cyclic nucleotide-gated cation channel alpha-4 n=1 Tax=Agelaius phoeniceus TaxID=39638 RepID=UPI0023EE2834|nr:cyclic nucleotide-gated cation channel alpha-4 [Agelaius phoeniceus]